MDSPHAIGFYASSILALGGGLATVLLAGRGWRALALLISGVGVAGIYTALAAGFAALVVLISFAGCALLLARPDQHRAVTGHSRRIWRQLGGVGAAVLLAGLAYSAFKGSFAHVTFNGGSFGSAAVGRLLFAHDALATEAVAALVLVALAGATVAWRVHDRTR